MPVDGRTPLGNLHTLLEIEACFARKPADRVELTRPRQRSRNLGYQAFSYSY